MNDVFFKPWIGLNYKTGGIFNKRILALGDSHYCGGCSKCGKKYYDYCEDLSTTNIVEEYLNGYTDRFTATYRKFERSLVDKETSLDESRDIWNSIAFYNYLQVAMSKAREAGTYEDYCEAQIPFLEVLKELKPELVIVWGVTRLYDNLPSDGWVDGESIIIDGYEVKNGYYILENSIKIKVIAIYHPSTCYDWSWWYKVISPYI